jgi:hypothetical protein
MQGTSHVISNNSSHDETLEVETNDSSYPKSSVADPSYNSIGHTYNLDDGAANQDMQMQMEQSMQRSVTLVFWYKVSVSLIFLTGLAFYSTAEMPSHSAPLLNSYLPALPTLPLPFPHF